MDFNRTDYSHKKIVAAQNETKDIHKLEWEKFFPLNINKQVSFKKCFYPVAEKFLDKNYQLIHEIHSDSLFKSSPSKYKKSYYENYADFFALYIDKKISGLIICTANDWSSYYIRSCSFLPAAQGYGYYKNFLEHLIKSLTQLSVERIEIDVAPNNPRHIHILNSFNFIPTGQFLSERWGALVRYTYYLNSENSELFNKQFCASSSVTGIKNNN